MFTGTIIGFLGSDAKLTQKGFSFNVSHNYKDKAGNVLTQWVCCFANWQPGNMLELLKTGNQVYVSGDLQVGIFSKDDGSNTSSVTMIVNKIQVVGRNNTQKNAE